MLTIRKLFRNYSLASLPLGIFAAFSNNVYGSEKSPIRKPNVIFIMADDLNDYGIIGEEVVKVPNIQNLRKSSVTFTSANCPAPLSIPSRASFFTGIYPHHSGVYANGADPWIKSEVLRRAETLPELFKRNGYYTFGRGKIYHVKLEEGRIERNFDNRPIYEGGFGPFPDQDHRMFSSKDRFPEFWGVQAFPDSLFPDVTNTNAVIDFLKEKHEKPFFVALGLWRPHTPFTAPQRFFDLYDPSKITIPKAYLKNDLDDVPDYARDLLDPFGRFKITGANDTVSWKHFIHGYYACTSFADWNIGRVVDALSKSAYARNTILVFFSDNGFHIGTKSHWEKNTMWSASSTVPLIFKIPGSPAKAGIVNSPVGLIDLYPTIVDLCGLNPPKQTLDGVSLRPLLENPDHKWNRPSLTSMGENLVSIQIGNYRYIQYPDSTAELYNRVTDPFEWYNLVNDKSLFPLIQQFQKYIPSHFMKELPGGRKN